MREAASELLWDEAKAPRLEASKAAASAPGKVEGSVGVSERAKELTMEEMLGLVLAAASVTGWADLLASKSAFE
jgi:hypothetical protein